MTQIIVRNLDDQVVARLKQRAEKARKSLEQTVRDLLIEATQTSREDTWRQIEAFRTRMGSLAGDSTDLIREDRDNDEPHR